MDMTKFWTLIFTFALGAILFGVTGPAYADTYYTVQPGDTLWRISRQYGVSVEQIQKSNAVYTTLIFPGQKLLISSSTPVSQTAEVSRGTSRTEILLDYAKSFTGVPYVYGGQTPAGFDCSGYVKYVFNHLGINLPRTAAEQFYRGAKVSAQEAKPGDIVAFSSGGYINHTGIYFGGGQFISSTSSRGVETASVHSAYWGTHFYGYSRIIP
ncbi:C40 family peptidase [Desulfoscipio gibsoniae]|uniref:Cell wall-associated hydrolase, invasion-associated protein n=1 Tax=Desulfoscipio gibsoniae DSM 7213 TaxID=767817 RepID=R4KMN9_9FIRM|nr:LysM peptidoglycan-binding domain-containing C40 family peptidase [Desulfoscipio gibsoniae]AGL01810.1 cell wall-associated hydrolase, invasion-associated protein [Desulfoscipio gibsoniae DSM 7213]